jgi:hypothetical protein
MAKRSTTRATRTRSGPEPGIIDTSVPHPARLHDHLLGGTDNFDVDRAAAERAFALFPGGLPAARANALAGRTFLVRVVQYLVREAGLRQFLDIGSGVPTANNVHEVAQRLAPECRVLYVDNDPIVLAHAHQLEDGTPDGESRYLVGDLRDPEAILRRAAPTLDLAQPVGILLSGVLHFVPDEDGPYGAVARLVDGVASGSWVAVSHLAADIRPDEVAKTAAVLNESLPTPLTPRDRDAVAGFFDGLVLVEPGVVPVDEWRPDIDEAGVGATAGLDVAEGAETVLLAAVGSKP